jgi:23S rRNA pseudouridine1911/1915/1917 synthase
MVRAGLLMADRGFLWPRNKRRGKWKKLIAMKHVYVVTGNEEGQTLEVFLACRQQNPGLAVRDLVTGGSVYVDGRRHLQPQTLLKAGARVTAHEPAVTSAAPLPAPFIVYIDSQAAVIDKPSGWPSQAIRVGGIPSLVDFIEEHLGSRARLLHRLDRDASGLLLVSLTEQAHQCLAAQLQEHSIQRRYLAVVEGVLPRSPLVITSRLSVKAGRTRSTEDPRGREAETRVRVLRAGPKRCLVQVELLTGRTHQIRAHLSEQGCPLVGDVSYGGPAAERLALHAHSLRFLHPSGVWADVHSPLPSSMRQMVAY